MAVAIFIFSFIFVAMGVFILADRIIFRFRHYKKIRLGYSTIAKRANALLNTAELLSTAKPAYSYTVDGACYNWTPNPAYYETEVMPDETEIFYDPENPKEATIRHVKSMTVIIIIGITLFLTGAVIIYFILWLRYTGAAVEELNAPLIAFLLGVLFAAIGAGSVIGTIRTFIPKKYKETYTASTAVCIEHLSSQSMSRGRTVRVILPIFEYSFDGVVYKMQGYSQRDKTYTNIGVVGIGERVRVWINPENPRIAYIERSQSRFPTFIIAQILTAAVFLFVGILVMVLALTAPAG